MIPVITIDGPSGSGKGTISKMLANELHWHYLDSGVVYRVFALAAIKNKVDNSDESALAKQADDLNIAMHPDGKVYLDCEDVTNTIRTEEVANTASKVSKYPKVRQALLHCQRHFRQPPGLVTDGRDMGTVVFPDATLKIFLTATPEIRARRRYDQLTSQGATPDLPEITRLIQERDKRDQKRKTSPTKPAPDAITLDTTNKSIDQTYQTIKNHYK